MPPHTATEITKLCDDWCAASIPADGVIRLGHNTQRFELLSNNVLFHELSHEALCAAIVGLSKVLLRPGMNQVINHDHMQLWSWCGEILLRSNTAPLFPPEQREIKLLYKTTLNAALANCCLPSSTAASIEEYRAQRRTQQEIEAKQPYHGRELLKETRVALAYLVFPLLEAVLKRACSDFVNFDGKVVTTFSVATRHNEPKQYKVGKQCSSMRDLLFLHHKQVACPSLRNLLDSFLGHISAVEGNDDPFDLIYKWRCQSLHGAAQVENFLNIIGGTLLCLTLLISIFEIEHGFEQRREEAICRLTFEAKLPEKLPGSFYPPY